MKRSWVLPLLVAAACSTASASRGVAPTSATSAHAVAGGVLLVRTPRHVRVALETIETLRSQDPRFSQFRVLVCGEAVQALTAGGELEPRLRAARVAGVAIAACGLSLTDLGMDPATLTDLVEVIPNALVEVMRLQADGWISVEL